MLVSVIIPYYKAEKYIDIAVSSVLKQSYKKWELIIIDDENSDKSKKALSNYKNLKKIKIFINKHNLGVSSSRNKGMKIANGEYCCFLDSDDIWKKKKLEKQMKKVLKSDHKAFFTSYKAIKYGKDIYKVKVNKILSHDLFIKECPICCSSVMLHKKIYKKFKFDKKLRTKEDYDLWLRISKKYKFDFINEILVMYRIRNNSLSSDEINKLINAFHIYRNKLNFNIFFSLYCILRLYVKAFLKKYC